MHILNITRSNFVDNVGAKGGALYLKTVQTVHISDSNFINNTAISFGGGLFLDQLAFIELKNVNLKLNKAKVGGGMNI